MRTTILMLGSVVWIAGTGCGDGGQTKIPAPLSEEQARKAEEERKQVEDSERGPVKQPSRKR